MKKDIYYSLVEMSMLKLVLYIIFYFVLINIFFAFLYILLPGAIFTGGEGTFLNAFFFSVQTISTVGYGQLSPDGLWVNTLASVEILFGMLSLALITGVFFSKMSKPHAKILFSKNILNSMYRGKRCLFLRIANNRGNDIIEANVSLTALMTEETPEGQQINGIHDLLLTRSRNPFFNLSWTIFHIIDESSPLFSVDFRDNLLGISVTVTGHDGTFSDKIYSRHNYNKEDIINDKYFKDIISLKEKAASVDYSKFHDLK